VTTDNQERELRATAEQAGHEVVAVYRDAGISGAKGRDKRPGFDAMHKDAARRRFDVVMAWSVDRLGRSLQGLITFMQELRSLKIDLFLHLEGLDTTTPAGKMMFQALGSFAEYERDMIRAQVNAGIARAQALAPAKMIPTSWCIPASGKSAVSTSAAAFRMTCTVWSLYGVVLD
jgi:DNA invertase Pin-like site-specific DNA recombinase